MGARDIAVLYGRPFRSTRRRGREDDAAIVYSRTGGIAGISERRSIYSDGRVVEEGGREGRIPAEEVEQLLNEIEAAGFFDWPAPPRSLKLCADCFSYSITVISEGKTNQITLMDGQTDAPEAAWSVLHLIQRVIESAIG